MKQIIYRVIYSPGINFVLRHLNKFLSPLFPKIRIPVSGTMNLKLKSGNSFTFEANQTDFVSYLVFWNGLYSYEYTAIFEELMKDCKGFVDIGANAGLFSLMAAKTNSGIKVLAFDPSQASTHYLNLNVRKNQLTKQIHVFNVGLSDKSSEMEFYEVKSNKYTYLKYNLGGSSSLEIKPTHFDAHKVKVWCFDDFIKDNHTDFKVDFVKIDAEGAEPKIIDGMRNSIQQHQPIIVCEILVSDIRSDLMNKFKELGYKPYLHTADGLMLISELKESPDEHRNCFFVPDSKKQLIERFVIK